MKVLVIAAVVGAVLAAPSPQFSAFPGPRSTQSQVPQAPQARELTVGTPVWPIRPYSYTYETSDPLTNNYQNKAEIKTASGDVFGIYNVLMPDNLIYTITYNSTATSGFNSQLSRTPYQPNQLFPPAVLPPHIASLGGPAV